MPRPLIAIILLAAGPLILLGEKCLYGTASVISADHVGVWVAQRFPLHILLLIIPIIGLGLAIIHIMKG